jgi:hypothetical protein
MPYLTLELLGFPVDLPADAQVALSYRVNDLRTLDSREAAFSETFTLPLTAQNVAVLGAPHSLDSLSTTPYRLLPAVLRSPGGAVLLDGFGILESSGEGYDVTLTDAVGGLFAQVGDRSLRELDLSQYDHAYTFDAVQTASTSTQGYCYVLSDDGRLTRRPAATGLLFYELTAAVYVDAILRAIFQNPLPPANPPPGYVQPVNPLADYQLTGTLLTEERFTRAVLPQASPYPQVRAHILADSAASGRLPVARVFPGQSTGYFQRLQFPQITDPGGNFFGGELFSPPAYYSDVTVHVSLRATVRHNPAIPLAGDFVALHLQDATITTPDANSLIGRFDARRIHQGAINLTPLDISADYEVTIQVLAGGPQLALYLFADVGAEVTILPGSSIRFTPGARVYAGGPVALEAGLPDLKQSEFLKLLFNQFNVIVQTDSVFKTIRFDLFNRLEQRRNEVVDWTQKLDLTQRPRLSYTLGDYAQVNTLAYDEAPKEYDQELGSSAQQNRGGGQLYVHNARLPSSGEVYQAPVILPQPHPTLGGATTTAWRPLLSEAKETRAAILWNNVIGYDENSPHIVHRGLAWKALQNVTVGSPAPDARHPETWVPAPYEVLNDELPAIALVTRQLPIDVLVRDDYPGAGTFMPTLGLTREGLEFTSLIGAYYPGLSRILERVQQLVLDVRLNALDIAGLDFTKPIGFNLAHWPGYGKLEALCYLNLIDQYLPGTAGAVACTFLVLGDPVAGLAPAVGNPVTVRRVALADELAHFLLNEVGQYLLVE